MRVLVTGATGFVGSAVVRRLLADGHGVEALVRDAGRARRQLGEAPVLREGDMLVPGTYAHLVEGVDAVVHTAMLSLPGRLTARRAERLFDADRVMAQALADACVGHGRRLVYTGGCFDWGDHGDAWIDEATPLTPSPLGVGHARMARELDALHRDRGLDVVRLSPGFVYGPGGLFASAFVEQAEQGRLRCLGAGRNWWSCVHVDDLASAYVAALARAQPGSAYAVVDDEPLRLRELTDLVTDAMGRPRVGSVPPALLRLLLGGPLVDSLTTSFRIRGDRVRADLGWTPSRPRFRDHVGESVAALAREA
ncbi:NAD-dependent epimerase/dehydratase family protein [Nocardioides sp. S-58]|uniref:NAD-dependent epimerase/dehydratase family protein n=1 Tax=Nocardioides renjunii TaxID=3095075 RepID=A0ABU5KE08_9ACTN|nr:NAD-dependent epimerase/dehydratase family protein [Nocardioides sp. S-58]MDZ5663182.1 NAD-dependent epimerase/dehydratase family protein [Nocardioides sp. S-58]